VADASAVLISGGKIALSTCLVAPLSSMIAAPMIAMHHDNKEGVVIMKPRKITQMALDWDLVERIDAYRRRQVGEIPTKSQAIRELLEWALRADAAELAGNES
jgi:hypothetical protein